MNIHPELPAPAPSAAPGLGGAGLALREAGYDSGALRRILAVPGNDIPVTATDVVHYEHRLRDAPGPLATIAALFCLGWPRPVDEVVVAVGLTAVDSLAAGGALVESHGTLQASIRILPHGELLVASDRRPEPGRPAGPWHVTGINPPATLLAALTVRRQGGRALDLGTGNGVQALLAASHADSVVATDVNPRAIAFGRFNAALNGVDTIEFRQGSWFEPVEGERFELVVSNPPYVISPDNDLVYRDSGDDPGALCGRLVHDVTGYLTESGFATLLVSWPLRGDDPWSAVPSSWLGEDAVAWLMMMRCEDPTTHAAQWNLPLASVRQDGGLGAYRDAVHRWERYLADRGVESIGYGAVVQQRRAGAGRLLRADVVRAGAGSAHEHVNRVFRAADSLGPDPTHAVAGRTCVIPAEARIEATLVPAEGGWTQGAARLTLTEGVDVGADLDPVMIELVLAVTGGATVDDAAAAVAGRMQLTAADACSLRDSGRDMVAELVALGLLELADT